MGSKTVRKRQVKQCELDFRSWGGARRGAGRKPKDERALVPHDTRPAHKARFPMLITSRLRPALPSLRHEREAACIRAALSGAHLVARELAAATERARPALPNQRTRKPREVVPFQVVHHSIQSNHLHLIVEAEDRRALTSGMRSLLIRIARGLNRLWKRSGPVFADRFHEHELHKPREVRNALVYVLQNLRKHKIWLAGPDPLSSGPAFDGWTPNRATHRGAVAGRAPVTLLRAAREETPTAKTWLLHVGWQRHGLIDPDERPRAT